MKKKTKPKTSTHLVLEGKVFLVERQGKKEVSREEIDGDVVLKCLLALLEAGGSGLAK